MADRSYLAPAGMPRPAGYTQVVKVDKTVYIAGQVSVDTEGNVVGAGDPEAQVRQVWRNLEAAVQSVGGTLNDIVKTTTYVTSPEVGSAVRTVREELYRNANPPTSTLLIISALAAPAYVVEIEAIAVVD